MTKIIFQASGGFWQYVRSSVFGFYLFFMARGTYHILPMTPSVVLTGGVWDAVTKGELLAVLRWKLDIGGRLALMSVGDTECGG